jgi:hypothetical protein
LRVVIGLWKGAASSAQPGLLQFGLRFGVC